MNAIVNQLDSAIREGRYPPNAPFLSERALSREYKVPLSIARKVLNQLCERGLVYRVERGGTFVNMEHRRLFPDAPDAPVQCINFIEPVRMRKDPFGFALADYLCGYTSRLQHHPVRVRFVTLEVANHDFSSIDADDPVFESLLNPSLPATRQACVIGDILSTAMMRWLDARSVPFVIRRHSAYDSTDFPPHHGVFLNRQAALFEATRHLIDLGHARIGFIGQIWEQPEVEPTLLEWCPSIEGFRAAFHLSGRRPPSDCEVHADGKTSSDVRRAAESLLLKPDRPTAIVCQNDFTALHAMDVACRLGLRVPGDLSVTGFDNDPAGALSVPSLSTFRGHEALAQAAIERLFLAMGANPPAREVRPVACEWVGRESAAPPPVGVAGDVAFSAFDRRKSPIPAGKRQADPVDDRATQFA